MRADARSRPAPTRLVCDASFFDRAIEHALSDAPREACGVVLGRRRGPIVRLREIVVSRNSAPFEPHVLSGRFALSPAELARYLVPRPCAVHVRRELVGFWHSHPHGAPELSALDLRTTWPGYVHIVVALRSRMAVARGADLRSPLKPGRAGAGVHAYWFAHGRVTTLRVVERTGPKCPRANSEALGA